MRWVAALVLGVAIGLGTGFLLWPRAIDGARPTAPASGADAAARQAEFWMDRSDETVRQAAFEFWRNTNRRDKGGVWQSTWLGVPTIQNPLDVWVTQEILHAVKPDFVVETGTHRGGSAALWATLLDQINPHGRVITIDINARSEPSRELSVVQRRVDFLVGSSTDPDIVAEVARRVAGKSVVVILDSAHKAAHVRAELEAYAHLVPVGSYVIVQDTGIGEPAYGMGGPADAVRDFLSTTDDFEVDLSRQPYGVTNNAKGFLRRVR
jgi:cephalosporin hydroxylase